MEQRIENRINHCLEVNLDSDEAFQRGWTKNISRHGMLISSENLLFRVRSEIRVAIKIGSDSILLDGVVCWNNEYQKLWDSIENQMGVFLHEPPPKYCDYINRLL